MVLKVYYLNLCHHRVQKSFADAKKTERGLLTSSIYIHIYDTKLVSANSSTPGYCCASISSYWFGVNFFPASKKLADLDLRGNYFQPADIYLVFVF